MDTRLVVSTHRNYVFDELAPAAKQLGVTPIRDYGLDIPHLPADTHSAWWMPSAHATRLLHEGLNLSLAAPGPTFLADAPKSLTGRKVLVVPFGEITDSLFPSYVKPAESKFEDLPAAWWKDKESFSIMATKTGLHADSLLQFSEMLDISFEVRCLAADGILLSSAPYVAGDELYFEGISIPDDAMRAARQHATKVLDEVALPAGVVLDVAILKTGEAVLLEPNPAWCAYWYDCDPLDAVATIIAANDPAKIDKWQYQPDPLLVEKVGRYRPLLRRSI